MSNSSGHPRLDRSESEDDTVVVDSNLCHPEFFARDKGSCRNGCVCGVRYQATESGHLGDLPHAL